MEYDGFDGRYEERMQNFVVETYSKKVIWKT